MSLPVTTSPASVLAAVDARDADALARFFADKGKFVFGNAEPAVGSAAIAEGADQFFATINGLHHKVVNEWVTGADTVVELKVTYDRLDGRSVTIPAVSIWHLDQDGLIEDYRVFLDLAPIYAT
jgi:ketosteroid isomerase-like protein